MTAKGEDVVRQVGEPSVEEILASIKKVIARDNRAEAEEVRRRREQEGVMMSRPIRQEATNEQSDEPIEEVLELTETVEMSQAGDLAATVGAGDEVEEDGPLLAANSRASMRDSLAALALLSAPGAPPQIVRSGETSLEALTRELLRPALAEWLEKNLPPLVERMVAAEISRIVGKKG